MEWIAQNWVWIVVAVAFVALHMFGHGGHGGHGGGHGGHGGDGEGRGDREGAAQDRVEKPVKKPEGHRH